MRIAIDLESTPPTITGDLEGVLVVVEAARRDLNAMGQALGASSDFKAHYGRLARTLSAAAADVPRVNLMDRQPFAGLRLEGNALVEAEPVTRYFYHPESDCLMRTEDGSHPGTDGLVEEIDEEEYERVLRLQTAALQAAALQAAAPAAADDIEDLLS